ncbi:MAG TPA: Rossmann-like and DUF2520 domain-containing protein [Pyrinomonadaceae bacterium]|nr:Rossmann-like and DUF2520 domain-containing protein [Pyrinomonadaceae bacterium]
MALPQKKKSKPSISIVGAGRLGSALALALSAAGYSVEGMIARRRAHARKAAALAGADAAWAIGDLELLPPGKVIFIATPDDEIDNVAQKLAGLADGSVRGRFVFHTSGALSSDVLAPLAAVGFQVGSLHPLVSVSDPQSGAASLRGVFYCVEGEPAAVRFARTIVRDLKGQSFTVRRDSKPLYHAAAVMASGHLVSLFDLAVEMLVNCGLGRSQARRVLMPLVESTVNNLGTTDPARALTGTFARGDLATVLKHLQSLAKTDLPEAMQVYRTLGSHALDVVKPANTRVSLEIKKALGTNTGDPSH